MDKISELLAKIPPGDIDVITAGIWLGAGFVLGLIMVGRRPLGLLGDIILGLVGAIASGWAFNYFKIDLGQYATKIASSLTAENAGYIGAFVEAFIGALVLLIIARLLIRR